MIDREFELPDPAATERAGAIVADWLGAHRGGVLFLVGELGAGKTSLARGLLRALGVQGAVRSPSYTLVEPYELAGGTVLHMDLYRLQDPDEFDGLGLRDHDPDQSWWIVEWPEKGQGHLPDASLTIRLSRRGEGRGLQLEVGAMPGETYERLFSMLGDSFGEVKQSEP